jgi:hypothetical protein
MYQTDKSTGVKIAPTKVLTGVMTVMNTMLMVAIDAQMMVLVALSTTITIVLMLSSIAPIRMNACTLG